MSQTLLMVTRCVANGDLEAEPVLVEKFDDGSVDITLDDGERLELDAQAVLVLITALAGAASGRRAA